MERREFIKILSLSGFLSSLGWLYCSKTEERERNKLNLPNIIYILVDDLGYGDINLNLAQIREFKNPAIKTPNLAKFAKESLVFRHHYTASPVCSPSRAGLLTGRTPTRCNIHQFINDKKENDKYFLRGEEITIPEILKRKGYQTSIFGKWHLNGSDWEIESNWDGWTGSFPKQQGFDYGMVTKEDPHFTRLLNVNTQKHPGDFFSVKGKPLGVLKGYTSDIISNAAISWIKNKRDASKPFFTYLSYDAVHIRIAAADKYEELYLTGDARKDAYYANITHLDAAIGKLIEAIDKMGLRENTLIFFSSDNGPDVLKAWDATYFCYGTSFPLHGQKYQLYEGGIRVPGMVRWIGKIQPGISDEPNSTLDVLPTLCELIGENPPSDRPIDGSSILDHILNGTSIIKREKPLYWQYEFPREYEETGEGYERRQNGLQRLNIAKQPRVAIREGNFVMRGYHYESFTEPQEFTLYDVVNDPDEQNELSTKNSVLYQKMRSILLDMYREVNEERLKRQMK
jgi:arylsulfatase A